MVWYAISRGSETTERDGVSDHSHRWKSLSTGRPRRNLSGTLVGAVVKQWPKNLIIIP